MKHLLLIIILVITTSCTLNNCDEAYCKDLSEKIEAYIDINKEKVAKFVNKEKWPYRGCIWTERVLKKVIKQPLKSGDYEKIYMKSAIYITDKFGNIKRKTSTSMDFCDPYLSEYILKYTEMIFRENIGYAYLQSTPLSAAAKEFLKLIEN